MTRVVSSLFDLHRERLVKYAYKMYLSQQTYYRVSALDTRLGGAEQRLTDDLSELASSVAHLYSSLTKPLLDCALVGIALMSFSSKMGAKTIPGETSVPKNSNMSLQLSPAHPQPIPHEQKSLIKKFVQLIFKQFSLRLRFLQSESSMYSQLP